MQEEKMSRKTKHDFFALVWLMGSAADLYCHQQCTATIQKIGNTKSALTVSLLHHRNHRSMEGFRSVCKMGTKYTHQQLDAG